MELQEYEERLKQLLTGSIAEEINDRAIFLGGNELLGNIKNRIINEGKDSDGNSLSAYSEKSGYFAREQFVKKSSFKAQGKDKGKKNKTAKTMYLEKGYKEFREIQGRRTDIKNLQLSGEMMMSYIIGKSDNNIVLGFNDKKQSIIRKGNEKREDKIIFNASTEELENYKKLTSEEIIKIVSEIFK